MASAVGLVGSLAVPLLLAKRLAGVLAVVLDQSLAVGLEMASAVLKDPLPLSEEMSARASVEAWDQSSVEG